VTFNDFHFVSNVWNKYEVQYTVVGSLVMKTKVSVLDSTQVQFLKVMVSNKGLGLRTKPVARYQKYKHTCITKYNKRLIYHRQTHMMLCIG